MKKLNITLILFICLTFLGMVVEPVFISTSFASSEARKEYYAKVTDDSVFLYSSPSSLSTNRIFEIPKSYFVVIMSERDEFYYARYNDVYGYIRKNQVSVMDGIPEKPFYEETFRVISLGGLPLYSKPSDETGTLVTDVPYLANGILFYGAINGDSLVPECTTIWYFCKYIQDDNVYQAYLYSEFCRGIDIENIPLNKETFSLITNPIFPSDTPSDLNGLSNTIKVLIIVGVSVPCVVILYLLIRPTLSNGQLSKEKKSPFKRKRKSDYFEFDENDLG